MEKETAISDRRRQTLSRVYHCLYESKTPCTKALLSQKLSLSLPTIYQCLDDLTASGLVHYCGEQHSTGGRRAQNLEVVSDARVAVGISITDDRIRISLADLRLKELAYHSVYHTRTQLDEDFSVMLSETLERFLDKYQVDRKKLLGVGIAIPGVLTPDRQRILLAPTLGLQNIDMHILTDRIPYPVFLGNDATCGGRAEWFVRGGRSNLAYLSLETGVGGAVLIGGSLYHGDNLRSGEFGHMCVEPAGLPCKCGKRGCLEAYCSAQRIRATLGVTLPEFFDGLDQHVPEYEALWHDILRHLAIGVNNIRMALDCNVVLGGFLTDFFPPYLSQLQQYVAANNTFGETADYMQLSALRNHSVPLGAALHFIQQFIMEF